MQSTHKTTLQLLEEKLAQTKISVEGSQVKRTNMKMNSPFLEGEEKSTYILGDANGNVTIVLRACMESGMLQNNDTNKKLITEIHQSYTTLASGTLLKSENPTKVIAEVKATLEMLNDRDKAYDGTKLENTSLFLFCLLDIIKSMSELEWNDGKQEDITLNLLGDLLADRGVSDILTLYLLSLIEKNKFKYEVLLSNHDKEYLTKLSCLSPEQSKSRGNDLFFLQNKTYGIFLVNAIWPDEAKGIYNRTIEAFKNHVELFDITLNDKGGINFLSHSPCGLVALFILARKEGFIQESITFEAFLTDKKLLIEAVSKSNNLWRKTREENPSCEYVDYNELRITKNFSLPTIQMINSNYSLDELFTLIAWGRFEDFDFLLPWVGLENVDQLIALVQKANITLVHGHDPDPAGFAKKKQDSMINLNTYFDLPGSSSYFTIIHGNLDIKIAIKKLLDQLSQPSPFNIELLLAEAGISDDVLLALNLKIENDKIVSPLFEIDIINNKGAQRLMNYISFKKEIIAAQDLKIRIAKDSSALISQVPLIDPKAIENPLVRKPSLLKWELIYEAQKAAFKKEIIAARELQVRIAKDSSALVNKAPLIQPKEIENSLVSLEPGALSWQILFKAQKDKKESEKIIQSYSCTT